MKLNSARSLILVVFSLVVAGCTNSSYGGLNYGEVVTPDGERWKIIGGKDETNVEFVIERADGTVVRYSAEQSTASTALAAAAEAQKIHAENMRELISEIRKQ